MPPARAEPLPAAPSCAHRPAERRIQHPDRDLLHAHRRVHETAPRRCTGRSARSPREHEPTAQPRVPRVGDRHLVASFRTVGLVV